MAAFVGFIVQSNGIHFPWAMTTSGITYADISAAGGPAAQWDALPTAAKVQILCVIGAPASCVWVAAVAAMGSGGDRGQPRPPLAVRALSSEG